MGWATARRVIKREARNRTTRSNRPPVPVLVLASPGSGVWGELKLCVAVLCEVLYIHKTYAY